MDNQKNIIKIFFVVILWGFMLGMTGSAIGESFMNDKAQFKLGIRDIPQENWEKLAQKRIYFGHQSVGYNIIDGIGQVLTANPELKLNIVESRDPQAFDVALLAHSRVGRNEDPQSKTDEFTQIMTSGIGAKTDIAFHKYCYIDINGASDVVTLFQQYQKKMDSLKSQYPSTRFVHVTVPLTTVQSGPKAWIKRLLGKPLGGVDANIKRNEFNELLVKHYEIVDPIFDLARVEAARPDGQVEKFNNNGKEYLAMYRDYTDDGGHLNQMGKKFVAERLLIFLAGLVD